jgi:hypothetical protein
MRRLGLLILLLVMMVGTVGSASPPPVPAGTVAFTCPSSAKVGTIWRCTWTWTATAGGAVSGNAQVVPYGAIIRVDFNPGSPAPTDDYDATLVDTENIDLLMGQGANRDTANSETVVYGTPIFQDGKRTLDLVIANAGNATSGTVTVWIRQAS